MIGRNNELDQPALKIGLQERRRSYIMDCHGGREGQSQPLTLLLLFVAGSVLAPGWEDLIQLVEISDAPNHRGCTSHPYQ